MITIVINYKDLLGFIGLIFFGLLGSLLGFIYDYIKYSMDNNTIIRLSYIGRRINNLFIFANILLWAIVLNFNYGYTGKLIVGAMILIGMVSNGYFRKIDNG